MKRLPLSPALLAGIIGTLGTFATPPACLAYSLSSFEWSERLTVKLADGRRIEGLYHGTSGVPTSVPYAARYAVWLDEVGPTSAPALGESLLVTRSAGEPLRGTFGGFADGDLLLASGDSCSLIVVRLNGQNVRRTGDTAMESDWIAARELWKSAPARYAYILKTEDGTVAVPVTAIKTGTCSITRGGGGDGGAGVAAGLVLGVVLGGVLAAVAMSAAMASALGHI